MAELFDGFLQGIHIYKGTKNIGRIGVSDIVGDARWKRYLNREEVLEFSIDADSEKAKLLTEDIKLITDFGCFTLRCEGSLEYEYEKKNILHVHAQGLYKDLEDLFMSTKYISNDPNTPVPADLAVIIVGGGTALNDKQIGTAEHALKAILSNVNYPNAQYWSIGTVDVEGIYDLEIEKKSVLGLIQEVQKIWGGYLIFDTTNRIVHLRDEKKWRYDRNFVINENKSVKVVKTQVDKVYTKIYPFGKDYLDIAAVNNGVKYLQVGINAGAFTKTVENFNITEQNELLEWGKEQLSYYSKPRYNYQCDILDIKYLGEYNTEDFRVGDIVRVKTKDGVVSDPIRIMGMELNLIKPWEVKLELGEPLVRLEDVLKATIDTSNATAKVISSDGKIDGGRLKAKTVIGGAIDDAAIDASKFNLNKIVVTDAVVNDNKPQSGSIEWNTHKVFYNGVKYEIVAGNTNKKYVVWRHGANSYESLTDLELTNKPLGDNDFIIFVNNKGKHDVAWYNRPARELLGSVFIADAAINDAKIANLSATKLTTGRISSVDKNTWIDLDTGNFSFKNALKWDANKNELVIGGLENMKQKTTPNVWYVATIYNLPETSSNGQKWAELTPDRPNSDQHIGEMAVVNLLLKEHGGISDYDYLNQLKSGNPLYAGKSSDVYNHTFVFTKQAGDVGFKWLKLSEYTLVGENKNYNGVKISSTNGIQITDASDRVMSELNKDYLRFYGNPIPRSETYTSTKPFTEINNGGLQFVGANGTSQYLRDYHIQIVKDTGEGRTNSLFLPKRFVNYREKDIFCFILPFEYGFHILNHNERIMHSDDSLDDITAHFTFNAGVGNFSQRILDSDREKYQRQDMPNDYFDGSVLDVPQGGVYWCVNRMRVDYVIYKRITIYNVYNESNSWDALRFNSEKTQYMPCDGALLALVK